MKRFLKFMIWGVLAIVLIISATGAGLWYLWSSNLPYIGSLKEYNPPIISTIYSQDGQVIGRFWKQKRILVSLDQVPDYLIKAFIAAEDSRFYEHEGVDFRGMIRAFLKNLTAGKIEQGASTITQQVTRSLLLKNNKKTYRRKAREAILSIQINRNFSKKRILYLYINQIYLGHGAYGVEAASRTYFNKSASELNLAEAAMLAGLPQAPSRYSPLDHFELAKKRQAYVLQRMYDDGYITKAQEEKALETKIVLNTDSENTFAKSPYFSEYIRRYLEKEYGKALLYRGGLKVYTTMNLSMQQKAVSALRKGLAELDKREGYRGPLKSIKPDEYDLVKKEVDEKFSKEPPVEGMVVKGIVDTVDDKSGQATVLIGSLKGLLSIDDMRWARKPDPEVPYYSVELKKMSNAIKPGDVILCKLKKKAKPPYDWIVSLEQKPEVQGALFSMENKTGKVRAMVGGRDFYTSQFDRATQAKRQPGSAFKPIIYAAALDNGMTPNQIILDTPYVSSLNPDAEVWRPKNYKEKFYGPTLFRTSLILSRNITTIKILKKIGVHRVIDYARKMGIESDLNPDLSLALGSSSLSLSELTTAYSVFANNGLLAKPYYIEKIEDRRGLVIQENQPSLKEVIPEDTAYIMTNLLEGVIKEGTGWRVKALKRPAAGKTGTTNDLRDAWFIGYTPDLVTGVWVGYDNRTPMGNGETGSRAASPIWLYYMSSVLKGKPVNDFTVPDGVVFAKIDAKTGLLASPYSKETVFQAFKDGTAPTKYSPKPEAPKSGEFSQFDMSLSNGE